MAFSSMKRKITVDANGRSNAVNEMFEGRKMVGTKWDHVSTGRTGWNTLLDTKIIDSHLETEKRNYGQGFIQLGIPGFTKGSKAPPINIGGRLMYPDEEGVYTIVDTAVVDKMSKMEEERRQYIESIIEKASLSNDICALILALNHPDDLEALLGAGQNDGGYITDANLVAVDAKPSALETYDPTSLTYSQAIQKFKLVIKHHMPIIDNLTPSTTVNQEL